MNIISERVGILAYQRIEAPSPTNNKCAFNTNENCKQRCMRCKSKIVNTSKRRFMTFQGCPIAGLYVKWGDKPVRNWSILYKIDQVNRTTSIIEQTCKHQFYDAVCSSVCTIQAFM